MPYDTPDVPFPCLIAGGYQADKKEKKKKHRPNRPLPKDLILKHLGWTETGSLVNHVTQSIEVYNANPWITKPWFIN